MPPAAPPLHSVELHDHEHHPGQDHGHAHGGHESRPVPTLLTSGLAYRLGAAVVLAALLWVVVAWALA